MKITPIEFAAPIIEPVAAPAEPVAIEPPALDEPWIEELRESVIEARKGLNAALEANSALKAAVTAIDADREKIMARLAELTAPEYRATDIKGVDAHLTAVSSYQTERDGLNRQLGELTERWSLIRPLITPAQHAVTKAGVAVTAAVDSCWRAYADRLKADLAPAIDLLRRWKLAMDAGGDYQAWKYVTADLLDTDDQTSNRLLASMAAHLAIPGETKPTVFTGVTGLPAPVTAIVTAPSGPTPQTMIEAELRAVQTAAAIAREHAELRAAITTAEPS